MRPGASMVAARQTRIREIFDDAADLPSGDRPRFVERACNGDAPLAAAVLELLKALNDAGPFLSNATVEGAISPGDPTAVAKDATTLFQSAMIGSYKLLERIGEGGFGTIYLAEQEHPVRRRVAVKIIKPGMDSQQVIARFEAERQA